MAKKAAAKTTRTPRRATPSVAEFADAISLPASPAVDRAPGTLPGFTSADLHPEIREAIKAFDLACDQYDRAIASINGQYLNALAEPTSATAPQVAALRALF